MINAMLTMLTIHLKLVLAGKLDRLLTVIAMK
jgi:hypothetical protein